jgi:fructose-bisphosphate aldolase, class I
MVDAIMMAQMVAGSGFLAALDQSGGSTPGALKAYGLPDTAWSSDEDMFRLIHEMRLRIITSPSFGNGKIIGTILFDRTVDGDLDGLPIPKALWARGIVPFLKTDLGLEAEADGVRLMKPVPDLEQKLDHAAARGIFGTKMRSVVRLASPAGIAAIVDQQFDFARRTLGRGLVPIVEPEVLIDSPERGAAEAILAERLTEAVDRLEGETRVILKLSIPAEADLYAPLVAHPRVARVVALSGGYSRAEGCKVLARNHGMIASFSRALLEELRHDMTDEQFDGALSQAIDEIYQASTLKR